jgi:hypothetical protein
MEVAIIRTNDSFLLIAFPVSEGGLIWVTEALLSVRFNFLGSSCRLKRKSIIARKMRSFPPI